MQLPNQYYRHPYPTPSRFREPLSSLSSTYDVLPPSLSLSPRPAVASLSPLNSTSANKDFPSCKRIPRRTTHVMLPNRQFIRIVKLTFLYCIIFNLYIFLRRGLLARVAPRPSPISFWGLSLFLYYYCFW